MKCLINNILKMIRMSSRVVVINLQEAKSFYIQHTAKRKKMTGDSSYMNHPQALQSLLTCLHARMISCDKRELTLVIL